MVHGLDGVNCTFLAVVNHKSAAPTVAARVAKNRAFFDAAERREQLANVVLGVLFGNHSDEESSLWKGREHRYITHDSGTESEQLWRGETAQWEEIILSQRSKHNKIRTENFNSWNEYLTSLLCTSWCGSSNRIQQAHGCGMHWMGICYDKLDSVKYEESSVCHYAYY